MANRSRRQFVGSALVGGFGIIIGREALGQDESGAKKINFACIGVGGKGGSDTEDASNHGNIVAICDVDDHTLNSAAQKYPDAKKYNDYRVMLKEMGPKIDAVTVSTPDHNHAAAAALAMRMHKHVFCQKPLTHDIYEARQLAILARNTKVATQMGNQGTAEDGQRQMVSNVRAGALGEVKEVHVWTNRPIWPQGLQRPAAEEPPSYLHWDLWLGTAPVRPYGKGYHSFSWRGWWDFGTGALGDMACHTLNMPFRALDLRNPISVQAQSPGHNRDSYPNWSIIRFEYAATKTRPAVSLTWYDGGKRPPEELFSGGKVEESGSLLIGSKGKLYSPGDNGDNGIWLDGAVDPKAPFIHSPGHFTEFARAIRGGAPAMSNFPEWAGPLTETVLLGNLAVWADGKKVEWDARSLQVKNDPELNTRVRRKYRPGYPQV